MNTSITKWATDSKRYVGFIDIMGFKNMMLRNTHEEVGKMLYKMVKMKDYAQRYASQFHNFGNLEREEIIKSVTFSDSILFVTKTDSIEDLEKLSIALSVFQEYAISIGAPTKGAISFGRLTASFEKSIFYGQPLIDAYLLQDQLYYYGIVVDNHVEAQLIKHKRKTKKDFKLIFSRELTPFKSGKVMHYNVRLGGFKDYHIEDMYKTVSGGIRKYVDNTIEMYNLMNNKSS